MAESKKRPQERWNEKHGYITKSFRMYKELAERFKATCERLGVSQSGQVVKMMEDFIEKNKDEKNEKKEVI